MITSALQQQPPRRALLSVSDKTGLAELAQALHHAGVELISTGGTAKFISELNLPVRSVSDITQFPEIMAGRVKTLHPKIHGGILARRDIDEAAMLEHGIGPIDIVVVNLYPFRETVAQPDCRWDDAVEQIDIGGPAMIRAAAKNHAWVSVLVSHDAYSELIACLPTGPDLDLRKKWAAQAFMHTAAYDQAICDYMRNELAQDTCAPTLESDVAMPPDLAINLPLKRTLRYGENPHQSAALYLHPGSTGQNLASAEPLQGKALSFNNLLDADAAWQLVCRWRSQTACVIVKHGNPCGAALGASLLQAYQKALACDAQSAFGGIIACNAEVDEATAHAISQQFAEVVIAPGFTSQARAVFQSKKNLRLLAVPLPSVEQTTSWPWDLRCIDGGLLMQRADDATTEPSAWQIVTERQPEAQDWQDLTFAWQVVRSVKSNAIVYAVEGQTLGIGAGQMSRVDSARIAREKATLSALSLTGAVMASDAFFPFADSVEEAAKAGIRAIVQPGGSMRDEEVIAAANAHDILMVMTGRRHFRH